MQSVPTPGSDLALDYDLPLSIIFMRRIMVVNNNEK